MITVPKVFDTTHGVIQDTGQYRRNTEVTDETRQELKTQELKCTG